MRVIRSCWRGEEGGGVSYCAVSSKHRMLCDKSPGPTTLESGQLLYGVADPAGQPIFRQLFWTLIVIHHVICRWHRYTIYQRHYFTPYTENNALFKLVWKSLMWQVLGCHIDGVKSDDFVLVEKSSLSKSRHCLKVVIVSYTKKQWRCREPNPKLSLHGRARYHSATVNDLKVKA